MSGGAKAHLDNLRSRAEALLAAHADAALDLSPEEIRRLAHDLAVQRAELELQNEELQISYQRMDAILARYAELYHKAPVGFLTLDANGAILQNNQTFLDLLGRATASLQGTSMADLLEAPGREVFLARYRAIFREPQGKTLDLQLRRQDGAFLDIRLSGRREAAGIEEAHDVHLLAAVVDISAERKAERERQGLEEQRLILEAQLHQAQRLDSLGSLAGGVAHDMNNVLAAIQALGTVHCLQAPAGSDLRHGLETIIKACERGGVLVKGLLGFARKHLDQEQVLDLNTLVREEAALLERTTFQRVNLILALEEPLPPVRGDAAALSHALLNLCVNAVDAMPAGGTLTLRTRNEAFTKVVLEVQDTGSGMAKAVMDKAIDPFFTTKPQGQGTGLGLAIVYGTALAHGGTLELESTLGQGTLVRFSLPACLEALETAPLAETVHARGHALRVLLIDDDELLQVTWSQLMEFMGMEATVVESGERALAELEAGLEVDVVVLDWNMPGLGGAGTLPRLRALRPGLPVIIATGASDADALGMPLALARVQRIAKPFTFEELEFALGRAVAGNPSLKVAPR